MIFSIALKHDALPELSGGGYRGNSRKICFPAFFIPSSVSRESTQSLSLLSVRAQTLSFSRGVCRMAVKATTHSFMAGARKEETEKEANEEFKRTQHGHRMVI